MPLRMERQSLAVVGSTFCRPWLVLKLAAKWGENLPPDRTSPPAFPTNRPTGPSPPTARPRTNRRNRTSSANRPPLPDRFRPLYRISFAAQLPSTHSASSLFNHVLYRLSASRTCHVPLDFRNVPRSTRCRTDTPTCSFRLSSLAGTFSHGIRPRLANRPQPTRLPPHTTLTSLPDYPPRPSLTTRPYDIPDYIPRRPSRRQSPTLPDDSPPTTSPLPQRDDLSGGSYPPNQLDPYRRMPSSEWVASSPDPRRAFRKAGAVISN